jgi:hypothetical protein
LRPARDLGRRAHDLGYLPMTGWGWRHLAGLLR